ncbi:MAG: Methyltransferase type 11 [Candidatus Thorarchaeota archaeon]|nr:MAG: Methyltransferase type 11 [Candidatus Thorarchaeota archaeon]
MIRKMRAWKELMKLGLNVSKLRKDIDSFFRGNILGVLRNEGWFDYLQSPRTLMQIAAEFRYTEIDFLEYLIGILIEDEVIQENDGQLFMEGPIEFDWTCPSCFDDAMRELWVDHARAIPDRLRGRCLQFTGGLNLFNWDDALSNKLYEQIRRAAFAFSDALKEPVRFLDVGSGNGRGTAAIWSYYYENDFFFPGSPMQIVGIDPNEKLLRIASEEFPQMVSEYNGHDLSIKDTVNEFPVEFRPGYAERIPYEDESFDIVFASQVLHWTEPKLAITEMMRVLKPGGFLFGTQNFYPDTNMYNEAHFKVVEGVHGFFSKDDMEEWAMESGAIAFETATPISVFKVTKGPS